MRFQGCTLLTALPAHMWHSQAGRSHRSPLLISSCTASLECCGHGCPGLRNLYSLVEEPLLTSLPGQPGTVVRWSDAPITPIEVKACHLQLRTCSCCCCLAGNRPGKLFPGQVVTASAAAPRGACAWTGRLVRPEKRRRYVREPPADTLPAVSLRLGASVPCTFSQHPHPHHTIASSWRRRLCHGGDGEGPRDGDRVPQQAAVLVSQSDLPATHRCRHSSEQRTAAVLDPASARRALGGKITQAFLCPST